MPNQVTYTFTLSDRFTAAARRISNSVGKATKKVRSLGSTATRAGRKTVGAFAGMKKAAIGLQTSMAPLLAGLIGVAGAMKFISVGTGFEDALADFSAITLTTGKDLQFVKGEALRLGRAAKVGSAEVAEAFKLVASGKSDLLETLPALSQVVEGVLLLKNAAGIDLAEAARTTVGALNAFDAGAERTAEFVNVLAAASAIGASEVGEIREALRKAAPAAISAKVSFGELNVLIQVLAKNEIRAAEAGTGLKTMMLLLETQADKRLKPSLVGVGGALAELTRRGTSTTKMKKMFGLEAFNVAAILKRNQPLINKWNKEFQGTSIATKQAAIRLATLSAEARGVGVVLQNKVIATFERLRPTFSKLVEGIGTFLDSITGEDIEAFAATMKDVLLTLQDMTSVAKDLGGFFKPIFRVVSVAATGLSDLGKLATGELTAENSSSFKAAMKFEAERVAAAKADIQVTVRPKELIESVQTNTSGTGASASGLNIGVGMQGDV